ncbi:MAG: carbohydrate kinase family protein, partial [Candidatus Levyibacteriota bacterium]
GRVSAPDYIFLNSVADLWEHAYKNVLAYAAKQSIPFAFSPGSRQLDSMNELVTNAVKKSEIFFSNKEEAQKILTAVQKPTAEMKEILHNLAELGPKVVSVTDGKNGGYARDADGSVFHIASYDPDFVSEDKTGAGDAYASGFFAAHILGKDIKTAMMWGAVNAHAVMGKLGAQAGLLTPKELQNMLEARPDFRAEKM